MYLSEEQIIKVISEYVEDERCTQAILIEGDWGSGKTFFVKGKLFNALKNNIHTKKSIVYTSLYGIENLQQVMKEIYASLMESFLENKIGEGKAKVIGKGINFMSKIASAGLGYFNIDSKDLPDITELKKLKNAILIFDDLERCSISVNQIFGFINNLVEHNDIKVIIVANQAEIGNMKLTEDLAQKYDVVLNKNLCLQTGNDEKKGNNGNQQQNQDKPISKGELIKYTEKLFSNDILYKKIKEKLIGVTIHYHSDFKNLYKSVIKEYIKDNDVNKYLLTKKNFVLNIFESKKHYNIRTLIFAIMAFEKIDILIKEIKFEPKKYIDEQRENILKYCITLAIHLKLGKKPYSWKDGTVKSGNISFDNDYLFGEHIFGYKFVDDYLLYRSFNYEEIKNLLIHIMEDRKEEDEYKKFQNSLIYNSLVPWWELEDDEIRDKLTCILKELKEKKYHPMYFKSIIVTLMQLKYKGFKEIVYNEYVSEMVNYLQRTEKNFNKQIVEIFSTDQDFLNEYNKIVSPIIDVLKQKKEQKKRKINECLLIENEWGKDFNKYCHDNKQKINLDSKFFFDIDIEILLKKIEKASVKDLYGLLLGIEEIYSFSNLNDVFKADIDNLEKMISKLDIDQLSDGKITKRFALEKIKDKLDKSLRSIKH